MRQVLAGFLVASLMLSAASSVSLAAATGASVSLKLDNDAKTKDANVEVTVNALQFTLKDSGGDKIATVRFPLRAKITSDNNGEFDAQQVLRTLAGKKANLQIRGAYYKCELKADGDDGLVLQFDDAVAGLDEAAVEMDVTFSSGGWNDEKEPLIKSPAQAREGSGRTGVTSDTEGTLNVLDVLVCDPEGNPIPMAKTDRGIDKVLNDSDGIQPDGNKVYFMIREEDARGNRTLYNDERYYRVRVSKGDNGKYVQSLKVVEKIVSDQDLYSALNGAAVPDTAGRHRFLEVEFKPLFDDTEVKVTFNLRLTPTNEAVERGHAKDGEELRVRDFHVYLKNIERKADNDWEVGVSGLLLKPLENDWNDVTWYDEDGDLAHMKFFADSDVDSFYSKLSTKWEHGDYAAYFNNQDAFVFDFTGSPKLSATSRADLEIYNPFVDADGRETIDPKTAMVYQVIDGNLYDVTASFEYREGENGEMAFCCRTRFLGTYIICEKPVSR